MYTLLISFYIDNNHLLNTFIKFRYGENFSAQDFPWSSENNLDSQIVVNADACDYRSEIITLMSQLLGNKRESDAHETISLDLFVNTYNEK